MSHRCFYLFVMRYSIEKLSQPQVLALLNTCNNSFTPPLSNNIPYTLEEYAIRLSVNAKFALCRNSETIIGFTAYYVNNEGKFAYIPQIWVSDQFQRNGIGSAMINKIISTLPTDIEKIRLEVRKNNDKAYSFYLKCNYSVIEEKSGKCLMEKSLKL